MVVAERSSASLEIGAGLSEAQARAIYQQGEEAVVFAMLELSRKLGGVEGITASQPSGMKPSYAKAAAKSKRGKTPGRNDGHAGSSRAKPQRIDQTKDHRAECCPDCGGSLTRCNQKRTRYTEDIPEDLQPRATEHTVHRDWCGKCHKHVEPTVGDALPKATIGNRTLVMSAWQHYGLGNTLSQVTDVFNHHFQLPLTAGGLTNSWHNLAELLYPWYERIQQQALDSAVLHGDETGWRVDGKSHWLWCFANEHLSYYMIDQTRSTTALHKFFTDTFEGTLVSDFWGAYNAVHVGNRQTCLVHLLRDLDNVEKYRSPDKDWPGFAKKLRRLVKDAIRLAKRDDASPSEHASKRARLDQRLSDLIDAPWQHPDACRLIKRLRRHREDLFTFVDLPHVPFDNNLAERAIRPAVITRKNSYNNRSDQGAQTQAVLMTLYRTLKQRHHHPLKTLIHAIETKLTTGQLPDLPEPMPP